MINHDDEDGAENASMLFHGTFYEESPMESTAGTFVYEDEASTILPTPEPPQVSMGRSYPYSHDLDDSVANIASVGSSFLNLYNGIGDDNSASVNTLHRNQIVEVPSMCLDNTAASAEFVTPTRQSIVQNESAALGSPRGSPGGSALGSCVPQWLVNTSKSLKFVIVLSSALLVGSLALICITMTVSSNSNFIGRDGGSGSHQSSYTDVPPETDNGGIVDVEMNWPTKSPTSVDVTIPEVAAPTTQNEYPSEHPTIAITDEPTMIDVLFNDTDTDTDTPTVSPTIVPIDESTDSPTVLETIDPTSKDTPSPTSSIKITSAPSITGHSTEQPSQTQSEMPSRQPSMAPIFTPSSHPTFSTQPSQRPTDLPTEMTSDIPSMKPSTHPVITPSDAPTSNPSLSPTMLPSFVPSSNPTLPPNPVSFFALAKNRGNEDMEALLPNLANNEAEFLIHLGNWNTKNPQFCREVAYNRTAQDYSASDVPVFVIPGKNEWNNCPDFEVSKELWKEYFIDYEKKYWDMSPSTRGFEVWRDHKYEENFSFVYKKALYIGLNLVSGTVWDDKKWEKRLNGNKKWVEDNVEEFLDEIEVVVIFGNSGLNNLNMPFFRGIKKSMRNWPGLQVLYIKQSPAELTFSENILDQENFLMLNVQNDHFPPTKITVDTNRNTILFDDSEWYGW